MRPPGVKENWDDNDWWIQQLILEYEQGRQWEENKDLEYLMKASAGKSIF